MGSRVSNPQEGQRVSYVGEVGDGLNIGDKGKVLSVDDGASHVLWTTGSRQGEVIFHTNLDLVVEPNQTEANMMASEFYTPLVSVAVRDTYDRQGPVGLLNALNDEGHLAVFMPIAEEAIQMVASRIRQEPSFREVLAELGEDDGAEFVAFSTLQLLRDAFGEED